MYRNDRTNVCELVGSVEIATNLLGSQSYDWDFGFQNIPSRTAFRLCYFPTLILISLANLRKTAQQIVATTLVIWRMIIHLALALGDQIGLGDCPQLKLGAPSSGTLCLRGRDTQRCNR